MDTRLRLVPVWGVTLLMIVEAASAAPHRIAVNSAAQRPVVNYCLSYHGNDCSFTTMAQCQATASGLGAECYRNEFGKDGETLHW